MKTHHCHGLGLLVDEATYRTLEKHLIIYVGNLSDGWTRTPSIQFVKLFKITFSTTKAMYGIIMEVLNKMEWDPLCLVGVATYGASSMIQCNMRLTIYLWNINHWSFVIVRCVAHKWIIKSCLCAIVDNIDNLCSGFEFVLVSIRRHLWIITIFHDK